MTCQLAQFSPNPCDGTLVRCHLIPKRMLPEELRWDHRTYVLACGGPMGLSGHHGELDSSRKIRIPRHLLPPELEEFAAAYGLTWWLEREYGHA